MKNSVIAVNYKVKPEHIDEFIGLIKEMSKKCLQDPGCLNYEASVDGNDVFLYEKYEGKEDIEYHLSTPHYKQYVEDTKDLLLEKTVKQYTAL